jgi:hypothetical protein
MGRPRKTEDEFEIQGNYGEGFECVTTEETWKAARGTVKTYRKNEPRIPFRVVKKRVKIVSADCGKCILQSTCGKSLSLALLRASCRASLSLT